MADDLDIGLDDKGPAASAGADDIAGANGYDPGPAERAASRLRRGVAHDSGNFGIPNISSPEEAERLRPGQQFVGPDGEKRVVPYKINAPEDLNNVPDGADFMGPDGELRVKPKYEPVDFTSQYLYNSAHSDKGRRKALERAYPGKVRDDPSGGFFIEDDDGVLRKPGRGGAATGGFLAHAAAPTLLGTAGAVAGSPFGGVVGGTAGAVAGGAAGSKVNDIVSSLAGVYDEEGATRDALIEGGLSGAGNVVGHVAGPLVRGAKNLISEGRSGLAATANKALGTDPEKLKLARELAERGELPGQGPFGLSKAGTEVPPSQWAKEAPALQNIVEVKEPALKTQRPLQQSAEAHYERSVGEILEGVGAKKTGSALSPEAAVSTEDVGNRVLESVRARSAESDKRLRELLDLKRADAERRAETGGRDFAARKAELDQAQEEAQSAAQKLIDEGFKDIDRQAVDAMKVARAGHNTGDLWRSMGDQLNAYRAGIQARAKTMYDTADELSGAVRNADTGLWEGGAVVDTANLSRTASAFLKELPDTFEATHSSIVRRLRDLAGKKDPDTGEWIQEPAQTTWAQLHDLRTQLRQNIKWNDLTSDVKNGTYKFFNNRVNEVLRDADNPATREAVEALNRADRFYRENMGPLENRQIQNLMDGLKSGLTADPRSLLDVVLKEGKTEVAQQIERIVGPNTWNALRAADTQEMLQAARNLDGTVNGKKFSAEVLKRYNQGLLETLHGDGARRLIDQATAIERLAGRLDVPSVPGDTMNDFIRRAHATAQAAKVAGQSDPIKMLKAEMRGIQKEHAQAVKAAGANNPMQFMMNPSVGAHEAVDRILAHPDMIIAASRAFPGAEKSTEFELLRQVWVQRFFQRPGMDVSAQAAKVTPEVQELMFPGVTLKQMHLLAKEMELLESKLASGAGNTIMMTNLVEHPTSRGNTPGIVSKAAKLIPGANFGARAALGAYYGLIREIATSPSTLRWLEKGLTSSSPADKEAARQALAEIALKARGAGAGIGALTGTTATGQNAGTE